jgi:hypothetical protein
MHSILVFVGELLYERMSTRTSYLLIPIINKGKCLTKMYKFQITLHKHKKVFNLVLNFFVCEFFYSILNCIGD